MIASLQAAAARNPNRPAIRAPGRSTLTYAGLLARIERVASGLAAHGVGPGDRVAVLAHNHPDTLVLLFACARLGAMLLPINWRLAEPEIDWVLQNAEPRILATDANVIHPAPAGAVPLQLGKLPLHGPAVAPAETDGPVLLVYTSGTAGRPKGALLTQFAILANAEFSRDMHALTADDHVLTVLPLFHVGGLNIQTVPALLSGATVTLHPRFEPGATLAAIAADRPTLTVLIPTTMQAMPDHPAWPATDLSSLRALTTGSTTVPPALTAPFACRGVPVLQVYGATETAPVAIYTRTPAAHTGHPGPGCSAMAVDAAGRPVPPGTPGEIWFRGPQLFSGYWRNPEATADALTNGWFHTGDIGTQAPDGSWTIHDRKKNLIVSGGENIYPAEIERVLHAMPGVAEAAVVGLPDPRWQEVPEAHVVLRPGAALAEADIIAHVRAELAHFKAPRRVHIVGSLPRNAMGKVQHALLRRC